MERLSDLSLSAAIALENLIQGERTSPHPIRKFITALGADQPDPLERSKHLASDYRRVRLYRQALKDTGDNPATLADLVQQVSNLLGEMQRDGLDKRDLMRARDFCIALNRALVNVEYESLYAREPGLRGR
jgi:hypothetical protein